MRIINLALCFISVLLPFGIFAQSVEKKSSENDLNAFYNQHIGKSAVLFSGPAYVALNFPMEETPFLGNDTMTLGWISYDGQLYQNVSLQWDVYQNFVLTRSLVNNTKMILRNELIDSFSFAGHLLKFIPRNPEKNLANEGFYDILYDGPTTLMARRKKILEEKMESNTLIYRMTKKNTFFIRKNGTYYQVSNKKDLAYLFGKDLAEIKRTVRRNRLKWKRDLEQILILAVVQYDKAHTIK